MRALLLAPALMMLGACASPLPEPDSQQAWVELYSTADTLLMADRLDGKRWPDGRYFQVTPGQHELQTRFQFEVRGGGGLRHDERAAAHDLRDSPALRRLRGGAALSHRGASATDEGAGLAV